jgi:hypothetical protein
LWLVYAGVGLAMLLGILPFLPQPGASAPTVQHAVTSGNQGIGRLALIYGLYGLGYIIPATFLSQMASAQFHGQWQADLFWPCFGLASAIGVVLVSLRRQTANGTRHWLITTLWLQAAGVFACLLGSGPGLALGVILCGTPFLACMQLVMQRSRELAPHAAQRNAGLLTACFAVGQLGGPLLAALSSHFSGGLAPALVFAGSGLLIAGGLLLRPVSAAQGLCANDGAPTAQR